MGFLKRILKASCLTEYEMEKAWKNIYYLTIFETFKEYKETSLLENNKEFNDHDKFLFEEFIKAINVHTDSNMNNYYRQMQKRLCKT